LNPIQYYDPNNPDFDETVSPLIVDSTVLVNGHEHSVLSMIDSGSNGRCFVDRKFVTAHNLPLTPLRRSRALFAFDGKETLAGSITYRSQLSIQVGEHHTEYIEPFVTSLGGDINFVLGAPWLRDHHAVPDITMRELRFLDTRCKNHGIPATCSFPYVVPGAGGPLDDHEPPQISTSELAPTRIDISLCSASVQQAAPDYRLVSAAAFAMLSRQKGYHCFAASVQDVRQALEKIRNKKPETDPLSKLPEDLRDKLAAFSKSLADALPPHRPIDHAIEIEPDKLSKLPNAPLYSMSTGELEVLEAWLRENLSKGFIRPSKSQVSSLVMFVHKL
jgi:hypothetical protein